VRCPPGGLDDVRATDALWAAQQGQHGGLLGAGARRTRTAFRGVGAWTVWPRGAVAKRSPSMAAARSGRPSRTSSQATSTARTASRRGCRRGLAPHAADVVASCVTAAGIACMPIASSPASVTRSPVAAPGSGNQTLFLAASVRSTQPCLSRVRATALAAARGSLAGGMARPSTSMAAAASTRHVASEGWLGMIGSWCTAPDHRAPSPARALPGRSGQGDGRHIALVGHDIQQMRTSEDGSLTNDWSI
jgi:hypothetical protein